MSQPEIDPQFASEIARQKKIATEYNANWGRMFMAWLIAGVVVGVGAWFFRAPMDRDGGMACGLGVSVWLVGVLLTSLFAFNPSTPKCPRCGLSWEQEGGAWPTWKHCPGCGLKMSDETGSPGKP
jgi:hypothetical protein